MRVTLHEVRGSSLQKPKCAIKGPASRNGITHILNCSEPGSEDPESTEVRGKRRLFPGMTRLDFWRIEIRYRSPLIMETGICAAWTIFPRISLERFQKLFRSEGDRVLSEGDSVLRLKPRFEAFWTCEPEYTQVEWRLLGGYCMILKMLLSSLGVWGCSQAEC